MKNSGFKKKINSILILLLIVTVVSCNQKENVKTAGNDTSGKVLIVHSGEPLDSLVLKLRNTSNIRQEGYVLIIPTEKSTNNERLKELKREFYKQAVYAVHVLDESSNNNLKKTDVIAIEKAEIICFTGNGSGGFYKWASANHMNEHLRAAYRKGATVAGQENVLSKFNFK